VRGQDHSLELQSGAAEIQDQGPGHPGGPEVIHHLELFSAGQFGDRFQLDDHLSKTDEVRPLRAGEQSALVIDRHVNLATEWDASPDELNGQGLLINRLQKPVPDLRMNLHFRADDAKRLRIYLLVVNPHDCSLLSCLSSAFIIFICG
jgi:hypothetical protein